jgi:hypothetical protein
VTRRLGVYRPVSDEDEAQALAQLASGTLSDDTRPLVEIYVAGSADARRRLERQRRVVAAFRAGGPAMPDALRCAVPEAARRPALTHADHPGRFRRRGLAALVVSAVVAGISLGSVALVGRPAVGPTLDSAATAARRGPTRSAPPLDPARPVGLRAEFAGVRFPSYWREGIPAVGERTDSLAGRLIEIVYYRLPNATRMAYIVVGGRPLPVPREAKLLVNKGVRLRIYRAGSEAIVTLERNGHTCILVGQTSVAALAALAAHLAG